jgi:tRNA dimethylallyltransferase
MKPKIVIILGPTAVGKSALAMELAGQLNGEIVNADSQQVYRYLDIGTGKPTVAERERVRHHLLDVVNPDQEFNAAMFRHLASDVIYQIDERQRRAIVCGGTGLYLKALTRGLFEGAGQDGQIRRELETEIETTGLASVYRRLVAIDPTVTSTIHPNDRSRFTERSTLSTTVLPLKRLVSPSMSMTSSPFTAQEPPSRTSRGWPTLSAAASPSGRASTRKTSFSRLSFE